MGSDEFLRLARLLLRQSDRHPIRSLNGSDLADFGKGVVRTFVRLGIIVQLQDLTDAEDVVFHLDDGRLIAATARDGGDLEMGDPLSIQCFEIDFTEICKAVRQSSDLEGPPVAKVTPKVFFLGAQGKGLRRLEVYMARGLQPLHAMETLLAIRTHAQADALVTVLTPTLREFPNDIMRQLTGLKMQVMGLSDMLTGDESAPFSLEIPHQRHLDDAARDAARLIIDVDGHVALFDGTDLKLQPRDFAVLVLLAVEAAGQGGFVQRDIITETLRASTDRHDSFEEQADKAINRIRDAFRKNPLITTADRGGNVENKPKVGYRLTISRDSIRVA